MASIYLKQVQMGLCYLCSPTVSLHRLGGDMNVGFAMFSFCFMESFPGTGSTVGAPVTCPGSRLKQAWVGIQALEFGAWGLGYGVWGFGNIKSPKP